MKKDAKYYALWILQIIFYLLVPLGLIFYSYSSLEPTMESTKFAISFSGVLLCLVTFLIFKRTVLKKVLAEYNGELSQLKADMRIETDASKIANLEHEIRKMSCITDCARAIPVALGGVLALVACDALQEGIIKFSGVLGFVLLSCLVGFACTIAQDLTIESKNKEN